MEGTHGLNTTVTRHFTVTGFLVEKNRILLHWHRKVKAWLPPGGHISENEDPVQAVIREILEETGLDAEVMQVQPLLPITYPSQVIAPFTIMVEDIDDPVAGYHQHIDLIYFCRPLDSTQTIGPEWIWVSKSDIANGRPIYVQGAPNVKPPDDVCILAIEAMKTLRRAHSSI